MGDFFSRITNGFREFWASLDRRSRLSIIIGSILATALVIGFVVYVSRPQMEMLYSNVDLSKAEAGQIMARLKDLGVKTKLEGTTIYVPKGEADTLQAQLATEGIGGEDISIPDQAPQSSIFDTSEDKRNRYIIEKQNKIKRGLKAIKGVEYVDVNVVIPEDTNFVLSENKTEASASLLIKMKDNAPPLSKEQVNGIVQFVSKSVQGLKPENITLLDYNGVSLVADAQSPTAQISTQMEMQDKVKTDIENSIKKFLEAPFGLNNVKVTAAVKLDFNSESTQSTTYIPTDEETKSGIVKSMQKVNKDWVDAGNGGAPGTDSNVDVPQYVTTEGNGAKYNEASETINYSISEINKNIVKEMGNIQNLTISVILNKTALKQDAASNEEQLKTDVQDLVKSALQGFTSSDLAQNNSVNVKLMAFNDDLAKKIAEEKANEAKLQQRDMMVKIGTAIAALLIFAAVVFLMLRRRKTESEVAVGQMAAVGTPLQGALASLENVAVAEIDIEDRNEVKKKLEKFVGQKPDAVAQLLKTWLNEE